MLQNKEKLLSYIKDGVRIIIYDDPSGCFIQQTPKGIKSISLNPMEDEVDYIMNVISNADKIYYVNPIVTESTSVLAFEEYELEDLFNEYDAVYEDAIIEQANYEIFVSLLKLNLIEPCGSVDGRKLYIRTERE